MESLNHQLSNAIQPDTDQAQRSAVGFELRGVFALRPDHPQTPFDDMLDRLDVLSADGRAS